jgi:hypothetical protein
VREQQHRQEDVDDQATDQDCVVVGTEDEGVADIGGHQEPGRPPRPPLAAAEWDRHDHQKQQGESQLVHRVPAIQQRDVAGHARHARPRMRPAGTGERCERIGMVGRQACAGIRGQVGDRGQYWERPTASISNSPASRHPRSRSRAGPGKPHGRA